MWPLPALIVVVAALRAILPMTVATIILSAVAGALVYAAVFVMFAVGSIERARYLEQLRAAARWRQRRQPLPPPTVPRPTEVV